MLSGPSRKPFLCVLAIALATSNGAAGRLPFRAFRPAPDEAGVVAEVGIHSRTYRAWNVGEQGVGFLLRGEGDRLRVGVGHESNTPGELTVALHERRVVEAAGPHAAVAQALRELLVRPGYGVNLRSGTWPELWHIPDPLSIWYAADHVGNGLRLELTPVDSRARRWAIVARRQIAPGSGLNFGNVSIAHTSERPYPVVQSRVFGLPHAPDHKRLREGPESKGRSSEIRLRLAEGVVAIRHRGTADPEIRARSRQLRARFEIEPGKEGAVALVLPFRGNGIWTAELAEAGDVTIRHSLLIPASPPDPVYNPEQTALIRAFNQSVLVPPGMSFAAGEVTHDDTETGWMTTAEVVDRHQRRKTFTPTDWYSYYWVGNRVGDSAPAHAAIGEAAPEVSATIKPHAQGFLIQISRILLSGRKLRWNSDQGGPLEVGNASPTDPFRSR